MNFYRMRWYQMLMLCVVMLAGLLSGCASDSGGSSNESLRIYEIGGSKATFTTVPGDETATQFQLMLDTGDSSTVSNSGSFPDVPILYFTNRGAQEAGTESLVNLVNNVWPRVYGTMAPNAILQGTTATKETVYISCIVDKPVWNTRTGQFGLNITYLGGQRPDASLALTDVQLIITNNSATVQPATWSHNLDGVTATLEASSANDGSYTLRIQKAAAKVYGITCAPQRRSETRTTKEYVSGWDTRFGTTSPNVSIAFPGGTGSPIVQGGGVFTATLSNPAYDESTGSISFKVTNLYSPFGAIGKTAVTLQEPTVFIDAGSNEVFPTYPDNVFSIQVRNSTTYPILVRLSGKKPPCSKAQADAGKCDVSTWNDSTKFQSLWESDDMQKAFKSSGTRFYKVTQGPNGNTEIPVEMVTTKIELAAGQVLRIVPPTSIKNGLPVPEWYYRDIDGSDKDGKPIINTLYSGPNVWVTKNEENGNKIDMFAPGPVMLYEFTLAPEKVTINDDGTKTTIPPEIWYDMSAVDGINTRSTMTYEGNGITCDKGDTRCQKLVSSLYKDCENIKLEDYSDTNKAGCPYSMDFENAKTCPNPKKYPNDPTKFPKGLPTWVKKTDDFDITDLKNELYKNILSAAEVTWKKPLTGLDLASAASGEGTVKPAYHIWWSTNEVGQGWLKYLQNNAYGRCVAYGWAYDEMKWTKGQQLLFDKYGNPTDGKDAVHNPLNVLASYPYAKDSYLNINILQVK